MTMSSYQFYIQRNSIAGATESAKNLEIDFPGLKYKSLEGIDNYGKPKLYTETYAESDDLRIFIPDVITRDNPEIVLTLCFFGNNRREIYHAFVEFITGCVITYWDTCRDRKIRMVLTEAIATSEDKLYGSTPYIEVPFKFKNCSSRSVRA